MNKLLVFMVSLTLLLWGAFLWKLADRVDSGKVPESVEVNIPNANLDMRSLLALLEPQKGPVEGLRDPFGLPKQFAPAPKVVRQASKKNADSSDLLLAALPPITLDAILPGAKPVAILKCRGESAVVSVGQEVWGATVVRIREDSVKLRMGKTEFEALK